MKFALLRALKGAPLSCLLALKLAEERPVGTMWVGQVTGYREKTVGLALRALQRMGLAEQTARFEGWHLTQAGRLAVPPASRQNDNSLPTATAIYTDSNNRLEVAVVEAARSSGENGGSSPAPEAPPPPEVVAALAQVGIGEPMRSRMAALPHVTPEYVKAHALLAREQGLSTGLLITRIRCGDPAPELNQLGHLRTCKCQECQSLRYRICTYCHSRPCQCEAESEDGVAESEGGEP